MYDLLIYLATRIRFDGFKVITRYYLTKSRSNDIGDNKRTFLALWVAWGI